MPKLNQKGVIAQVVVLLLLAAGLIGGLYLVKHPTFFKPKASELKPASPTTSFTLSTGPLVKSYGVGEEVVVQILVHSDITAANLFDAKINFDPEFLKLGKVDVTSPFIKNWVEQYWADPGKISLVGGVPNPGFQSKAQDTAIMATLYFKASKEGNTTISFDEASAIYSNADNANILTFKNPAAISISSRVSIPEKSVSYNLEAGWNGIGVPINNPDQSPAQLLEATGGKCTDIQGFNPVAAQATFYTSDPAKRVLNSLTEIVGGQGYLVKCSSPTTLKLTGPAFVTAMPQLVASNVQYVSLPKDKTMNAEEFLEVVSNNGLDCTKVYRWVADGWEGHTKGRDLNNFVMNDKEAYDVSCAAADDLQPTPTQTFCSSDADCPSGYYCPNLGIESTSGIAVDYTCIKDSKPSPTPKATPAPGTGDGNNDGKTNLVDLSVLLSDFNKTTGFRGGVDLNGDGKVNTFDFSLMRNLLIEKKVIRG